MTSNPSPVRRLDWPARVSGGILAGLTIMAYGGTLSVPLLFDDVDTIAKNPTIRHWSTAFLPPSGSTAGGRPILNFSMAVNYAISGTAVWSYHVVNLAIHILAGLTLFGIFRRTLAPRAGEAAVLIAFSAALLWVLHPLQTESVTYLIQRAESLMGLFYLLTVYCFIRGAQAGGHRQRLWFTCSVAACLLGMATKEVMVSVPLIVLLYDRTFLAGGFREAWRRRWRVYAGLGATWLILPFLVLSTHGRGGTAGFGSGVSWWSYAPTQFPAILRYLSLSVWPHPLVFDYGTRWVTNFWAILPSAAVVVGLIASTAWALLRPGLEARSLGFAGAWFFAVLAPTSLIPGNRQTAAEHRMYLALIPVVALVVIGIYRRLGRGALPFCLVVAAAMLVGTYRRNEVYHSALALWTDTVAHCPENGFAHNNLGCELENLPGRRPEAVAEYEEALRLNPDDAGAHNNLGNAWARMPGRLNDAIVQYEESMRLKPGFAEVHYNLGSALKRTPGRLNDAIAQFEEALRLNPDYAAAHNNLGNAFARMPGRLNDAIGQYEAALRLNPEDASAHNNLGNILSAEGRTGEAIVQYEEALRLKPDDAEIHFDLAVALLRIPGRTNEAVAHLEATLRLQPENDPARRMLVGIRANQP